MKKFLFIIYCSLTILGSFGQTNVYHPFPDSNAIWFQTFSYLDGTCWADDDQNLYISGDTTIGSYTYHKLYKNGYVSEFCPPPNNPFPPYYYIGEYWAAFRQDIPNRKVYLYVNGGDTLAYDFNLTVGDTLPLSILNIYEGPYIFSIDSVLVGNNYNKRFWLTDGWNYNYPNLIEGIGNSFGAFATIDIPFEWNAELWCVKINDQVAWKYDSTSSCSLITHIEGIVMQIQTSVNPNPFSFSTIIRTNKALKGANLTIYNALGQEVKRIHNISGREIKVYRDDLPLGVYIFRITQSKKIIFTDKVVITN